MGRRNPGQRSREHALVLLLIAGLAALLFLLGLGETGLVDETPPLFAAAARGMVERGDWLIPQVNGLPRYDKPPLVYWLMGLGYALPAQSFWNPLGTWAARLPSALATMGVMVALADTLLAWPQGPTIRQPGRPWRPSAGSDVALSAALALGLGPMVLLWGRIAVSDALFSALLALSLLLAWRTYAAPRGTWWPTWLALALAVLTKGPVAIVLLALTLLLFGALQGDGGRLWSRLRPGRGMLLLTAVAGPWYLLALLREGEPFWRSFFGYHNLARFSQVVNNHHQPWWYFLAVSLVAALPFSPLMLLGLQESLRGLPGLWPLRWPPAWPLGTRQAPAHSLQCFASCWLLAVLVFFSLSATKLPSYWLPASPAAALLVALAADGIDANGRPSRGISWAFRACLVLLLALAAGLAAAPLWLGLIREPSMPGLQASLLAGPWFGLGALLLGAAAVLLVGSRSTAPSLRLLRTQLPLVALVPLMLLPLWRVSDGLRGAPVRDLAALVRSQTQDAEPLAMVGLMKPSLHYYSRRTVLYEGRSPQGLLNLVDRLRHEQRPGLRPSSVAQQPNLLLVIDAETAALPHWLGIGGVRLAAGGPYTLLRLDRRRLEQRAQALQAAGLEANWRDPRPERY